MRFKISCCREAFEEWKWVEEFRPHSKLDPVRTQGDVRGVWHTRSKMLHVFALKVESLKP